MTKPIDNFIGETCEHCGYGTMNEINSDWWIKCNDCGALKFCYIPLPHQERFHADPSKYKLFAGGY
jgi:hypothetical protein